MSVFSSLSLVAGGCLRQHGHFLLGAGTPPGPVPEQVASLPGRQGFPRMPDRWRLAIALGEVWDDAQAVAGNRPVYLRGQRDPDTGRVEVEAVIAVALSHVLNPVVRSLPQSLFTPA